MIEGERTFTYSRADPKIYELVVCDDKRNLFTPRALRVLDLILKGNSYTQIASTLGITERTIYHYVSDPSGGLLPIAWSVSEEDKSSKTRLIGQLMKAGVVKLIPVENSEEID